MFRKRLVAVCILASVALPSLVVPRVARAQDVIDLDSDTPTPKKKGKGAKAGAAAPAAAGAAAPKKPGKGVDIDLDEDSGSGSQAPVVAGQMTEAAAAAKQLFDKERWNEAAQALHRVVSGETGDDPGNKQLAEYFLAISLYRLKFYQASYAIFSVIADNPNHVKFKETLLWLAKLATQLPEPADIIERVGKYNDEQVGRFDNDQQRDLFWQLNYMLGRYKYRNRQYEEAIRLFQKVDRRSEYYVKSQFFTGISYVQVRKSVPAVQAFQRIQKALDEGVEGVLHGRRLSARAGQHPHAAIAVLPELVLPGSVGAQGRHLLLELQLRSGDHRRCAVQQEVHADQGPAREGAEELQ